MPLSLARSELLHRLYFHRPYIEAARAIGYGGVEMSAFWEKTKALGIPSNQLLTAVYDLTRGDRREEKPSRYELRDDVKELCWQLLGPPPEKEDAFWRHPNGEPRERPKREPEPAAEAEPAADQEQTHAAKAKKPRKERGR